MESRVAANYPRASACAGSSPALSAIHFHCDLCGRPIWLKVTNDVSDMDFKVIVKCQGCGRRVRYVHNRKRTG